MTFEEICAAIRQEAELEAGARLPPSFERSLRRALQRMVSHGGGLIAIGRGGRADPFRSFMDPLLIAMAMTKEQGKAWLDALAADPGAAQAMRDFGKGVR